MRTHILTALAVAVFSVITWELFHEARKWHLFLAAGTIIEVMCRG